jgi:predicted amidophosphoribosyltransferase
VDVTGDGRGALTAAGLLCGSCGTELPPNSKFCNECGAPVAQVSRSAEYKQVTVLDVQKWLDESVMAQDTAETERNQPNSAARDNLQGRT